VGDLRAYPPAAGGIEDLEAELPALGDFYDFSIKISTFRHICA